MSAKTAHQILFFLRFVQLGAVVLTGFVALYLAWWHGAQHEAVPRGLVLAVSSLVPAFVECYASSAHAVHAREPSPDYRRLLRTAAPAALLVALGYRALRQVPYVREWCEGDNWAPMGGNVEERNCALVCVIIVAGGIAVAFTGLVAGFAGVGVLAQRRGGGGGVRLGDLPEDYVDDEVFGCAVGGEKEGCAF